MGNRAVITVGNERGWYNPLGLGLYLHWNGGRDSVTAFLTYCKMHKWRAPSDDSEYGFARLAQVISNFFGGDGLSCGVGIVCQLDCDNYDNGVYTIDGWEIVGRKYFDGAEQDEYPLKEMLLDIDDKQPAHMQIRDFIEAEEVQTADLQIGDEVVWIDYSGRCQRAKVIGIGEDRTVNGRNVLGIPYIDFWGEDKAANPNNYLYKEGYRRAKAE